MFIHVPIAMTLILGISAAAAPDIAVWDASVTDAIESELLFDPGVPPNRIDINVDDGIVTLSGSVPHLLAKERAASIAETVKGVRAVINRLNVHAPARLAGKTLKSRVEQALLADPATDSYEIDVTVDKHHVKLSGSVESWAEKQLCGTVAKGVNGVQSLTNKVNFTYTTDRLDSEIEADIKRILHWNALVDNELIEVDVKDGAVTLTGTVGSAAEKTQARSDAWTMGVKSIDDSGLTVARWARDDDLRASKYTAKPDRKVQEAVKDAWWKDPRVANWELDLSVHNGVATLRGVVDNLKAKRAAEQDAKNTVGVLSVRNYIKVRPVTGWTDTALEEKIRQAFQRDPYVDRFDIRVSVINSIAYLDGSVDSYFEKGQADDLAARVDGVVNVVNTLNVSDDPYTYDPFVDHWSIYDYPWYRPVPFSTFTSDWQIELNIKDELFWSPFVDADDVTVEVTDGVATLTGTVDSWMEHGAARDNAYEAGATYVRNELKVVEEETSS